nr:MAG TPA: hypothetical protein [Crassvirales sp.]DAU06359.1 MAG TPA: hypothetical protein [Caudoviricetes sp.]DAX21838.1 MAG TPA: hypothetical protein [Caudoviricetes sp.]
MSRSFTILSYYFCSISIIAFFICFILYMLLNYFIKGMQLISYD